MLTACLVSGWQGRGTSRSDDSDQEEDERTLMNFKAHKGWVSAVRFLEGEDGRGSGGGGGACRLLSSANDSVVKLWDTSKQHRGLPRYVGWDVAGAPGGKD